MKYKVSYTLQRDVFVEVDITDNEVNEAFTRLGEVKSNEDFTGDFDLRRKIEEASFEEFSAGNYDEDPDAEMIVDRSITLSLNED